MSQGSFLLTSGVIYLVIAVLHVFRLVFGWDAVINNWVVPSWASWAAIIVAGYLSLVAFKLRKTS